MTATPTSDIELEQEIGDLMYLYRQAENTEVRVDAIRRTVALVRSETFKARTEQIMQDELAINADDNFADVDESHIIQWRVNRLAALQSDPTSAEGTVV